MKWCGGGEESCLPWVVPGASGSDIRGAGALGQLCHPFKPSFSFYKCNTEDHVVSNVLSSSKSFIQNGSSYLEKFQLILFHSLPCSMLVRFWSLIFFLMKSTVPAVEPCRLTFRVDGMRRVLQSLSQTTLGSICLSSLSLLCTLVSYSLKRW